MNCPKCGKGAVSEGILPVTTLVGTVHAQVFMCINPDCQVDHPHLNFAKINFEFAFIGLSKVQVIPPKSNFA